MTIAAPRTPTASRDMYTQPVHAGHDADDYVVYQSHDRPLIPWPSEEEILYSPDCTRTIQVMMPAPPDSYSPSYSPDYAPVFKTITITTTTTPPSSFLDYYARLHGSHGDDHRDTAKNKEPRRRSVSPPRSPRHREAKLAKRETP